MALEVFALAEALAGADDEGAGEGEEAADHVDDAGAGVVGEAGADLCQPALIAPCPVAVDGVDERADDEAVREVGVDLGALGDGSGDDGGGRAGEDHLEEPCDEVGVLEVEQEEALEADDARGRSAAHHERIAEGPESEGRYAEVEERLGHVVDGVLGADEARAEEGESGLHEEDEGRGGDEDEVVELRVDVVRRDRALRVGDSYGSEEDAYAEQGDHRQPELRGGQVYRFCQCVHCCSLLFRITHLSGTGRLYSGLVASVLPFCYISVTEAARCRLGRFGRREGSTDGAFGGVGGGVGGPIS